MPNVQLRAEQQKLRHLVVLRCDHLFEPALY
jgi:hypothetical protein